jgi:hypothetical protein
MLISAVILFLLTSCNKDLLPYSIFKNSNYKTIEQSSILINLNSSYSIVIKTGYESSTPRYLLQKNNSSPYDISDSSIVSTETHGWNGQEQLNFETIRINLEFDTNNFAIGDKLKIISRHSGIEEFKTIEIE